MHILATGFAPFPGAPENPTELLMRHLAGISSLGGAALSSLLLPTTFDVFEIALRPAIERLKPDVVVSFGLSAKAMGMTFERTARNAVSISSPDAVGNLAASDWIDPLGPATLGSGLPLSAMAAALADAGIAHDFSDDAGAYLCNLVFYRTRRLMPDQRTGFIHVPYTTEQRDRLSASGAIAEGLGALDEQTLFDGARRVLSVFA